MIGGGWYRVGGREGVISEIFATPYLSLVGLFLSFSYLDSMHATLRRRYSMDI